MRQYLTLSAPDAAPSQRAIHCQRSHHGNDRLRQPRGAPQDGMGLCRRCLDAGATVLFDTGSDGATLLANMRMLEIEPFQIGNVVMSHIQSDHIGGLNDFLRANPTVEVLIPAFPGSSGQADRSGGVRPRAIAGPTQLVAGVYVTGPLGNSLQEQASSRHAGGSARAHRPCASRIARSGRGHPRSTLTI